MSRGSHSSLQNRELVVSGKESIIKSNFHVDHTEVNQLIAKDPSWALGTLEDGDEFFAFIFSPRLS